MAITVNIYYRGEGTAAGDFAREMVSKGIVDQIRSREGNLRYDYFFPMEEENCVLLIDSWKSQEAIDEHHASPLMGEIAVLRDKYDLHMTVERYVTDADGGAGDEKFIRK